MIEELDKLNNNIIYSNIKDDRINNNISNILSSKFSDLNDKIFFNKVGEKLICKFVDLKNKGKRIILNNLNGDIKASLNFSYMDGYFYIDAINAYDHGKGNGGILLDEFIKKTRGKKIFLQDNAYIREGMSDTYIRLNSFYSKRGFIPSKIEELRHKNVLFKGDGNEGKILYKYYKKNN